MKKLSDFRKVELFAVLVAVATVVLLLKRTPGTESERSIVTPSPTVIGRDYKLGDLLPTFTLQTRYGHWTTRRTDNGPFLFSVFDPDCAHCLQRKEGLDREAFELMRPRFMNLWTLVDMPYSELKNFTFETEESGYAVLSDPGGKVARDLLGGSDTDCWLLVGNDGRLLYKGPADLDNLRPFYDRLDP